MKKTLVSALTTALVVGAASTTFAAANPFSDVPADHWAYDAVAQLAADGVIDGYGDSTFKGDRNITRYEMAQMVAKAMAKSTSGADKALVDKLAAEFADELNNLGVRVANLERNADMVKWNGKAEYTFTRKHFEAKSSEANRNDNDNTVLFRLEPSAEVNSNWHVNARLDATSNLSDDTTTDVSLKRVWAQGDYKNFQVKLGKFGNSIANDVVFDDTFSGAEVTFGNQLKATVAAGRVNGDTFSNISEMNKTEKAARGLNHDVLKTGTADYFGIGVNYDAASKLSARAGYQHFRMHDMQEFDGTYSAGKPNFTAGKSESTGVWNVGAGYKFDKNVALDAVYARSNVKDQDAQKTAFAYTLSYKEAQPENKGSWGAWAGYRFLGNRAAMHPTYDVVGVGYKGLEIGVKYTALKNVVTQVQYGNGSKIGAGDHHNYNTLFGRVEFLF